MVETSTTTLLNASSSSSSSEHLTQLLHRQNHPNRPLLSLKDLSTHRSYDHSWPTFTESRRFTDRHTYASDASFVTVLQNHNKGVSYALLKAVGAVECKNVVRDNHIVLYGGALVDIVLKREEEIADWDLRLIGPDYCDSEEKCVQVAQKFVQDVFQELAKENERIAILNARATEAQRAVEETFDVSKVTTSRFQSTVTITVPGRWSASLGQILPTTLQLTFAPYSNVRELFGNSLPHCTRIALLNDAVVLDELAHYCLESVCVILRPDDLCHTSVGVATKEEEEVDDRENPSSSMDDETLSAPSLAYEVNRFIKYFYKGFDIVVPGLDMTTIPRRLLKFDQTEVLDLPFLTVYFNKVDENKIMVSSLVVPEKELDETSGKDSCTGHQGRGGYGSMSPRAPIHVGSSAHHNIQCLIRGDLGRFHYVAEGERTETIFDTCPLLTSRMIGKAYEMVEGRLSTNIDVQLILDYFGCGVSPSEVLTKLVLDRIQTKPRTFQIRKTHLTDLITREKEALLERVEELPQVLKEQGRDTLLHRSRSAVSTPDQVRVALLGSYAKRRFF